MEFRVTREVSGLSTLSHIPLSCVGGGGVGGGGKEGIYVCLQKLQGKPPDSPQIIVPPHMTRLTASPKLQSLYL